MRCNDLGPDLARYRELSAERREQVDAHLAGCPACAARLASYAAQDRALAALSALQPAPAWVARVRATARSALSLPPRLSVAQRALMVAAAMVLLLSVSLNVSANALPGDLLYPLKRAQEALRLRLAVGEAAESAYCEALQVQRRQEAERLIQAGRAAQVEFEGALEPNGQGGWLVSGVPVRLGEADSALWAEGDWVAVRGRTGSGAVEALEVRVLRRAQPDHAARPDAPTHPAPPSQQQGTPPSLGPATPPASSRTPMRQDGATPPSPVKPQATPASPGATPASPGATPASPGATAASPGGPTIATPSGSKAPMETPQPTPTVAVMLTETAQPAQPPQGPPPDPSKGPSTPASAPPGPGPGGGQGGTSPTPESGAQKGR